MFSTIRDIVTAVVFWVSVAGVGGFGMEMVFDTVRSATQDRVSIGLSPMTKFTEKLVSNKDKAK